MRPGVVARRHRFVRAAGVALAVAERVLRVHRQAVRRPARQRRAASRCSCRGRRSSCSRLRRTAAACWRRRAGADVHVIGAVPSRPAVRAGHDVELADLRRRGRAVRLQTPIVRFAMLRRNRLRPWLPTYATVAAMLAPAAPAAPTRCTDRPSRAACSRSRRRAAGTTGCSGC